MEFIDHEYINLVNNIINNGYDSENTRMLPMQIIRANNINNSFPIVQHKKLFVRGVWEELLFFLKGDTDVRKLQNKGVHIWDANADPEYKKKHNKHLSDFDLGPVYGYQWRNFNSQNKDQLMDIILNLKNKSLSRRLFMSAWNPCQLDEMVLPPCHISYHFIPYVKDGVYTVDLMLYQRSADVMLGLPFNIASASFMLLLICKYCGVVAGNVSICIGNAHVYNAHMKSLDKVFESYDIVKDNLTKVKCYIEGDISVSFDEYLATVSYKIDNYYSTNKINFDLVV